MIEGSGSGFTPMTNRSGSERPKNMCIRWIRIRIRNSAIFPFDESGYKSGCFERSYIRDIMIGSCFLPAWACWWRPLSWPRRGSPPPLRGRPPPSRHAPCSAPPPASLQHTVGHRHISVGNRIRIHWSLQLVYGSGFWSFLQWISRWKQKKNVFFFPSLFYLLQYPGT